MPAEREGDSAAHGSTHEAHDDSPDIVPIRPPYRGSISFEADDDAQDLFLRPSERDIGTCAKLSYGTGHFYNDLCASMWFTYLMLFLEKVLGISPGRAGFLMLVGQVTDAVCTPLVGIASDSSLLPSFFNRIGRRISWHAIGTFFVSISFPFIYNTCLLCDGDTSEWLRVGWFVLPIMLFQFGWASVQIAHLALIPDLTHVDSSRRTMNSLRYGATVLANLTVYGLLAYLLYSCSSSEKSLVPEDISHFRMAAMLVVGLGLLSSIPFYAVTREPEHQRHFSRMNSTTSHASQLSRMHWTSWFGNIQFYQIALLYMLSRLYMNVSQVYMSFYLLSTQGMEKKYIALIPMVSFISSFLVSSILSITWINKRLNKKVLYVVALLVGMGDCVYMFFPLTTWEMFSVAFILGFAQSILLVTSLDITSDLINKNSETGAFVYGAMSFVDKLANGVAYQIIELINPQCEASTSSCSSFYRNIMVFVPGGCLLLSFLILLSLLPVDIGRRRRRTRPDDLLAIIQVESEREEIEEAEREAQRLNQRQE